ncbi:hypothetical protein DFJ77DRAFT_445316 [Powellomyces hirtus]|nr:hypothetical protein DFJ77DRAFT_445316 [Powellomyces hirtus]
MSPMCPSFSCLLRVTLETVRGTCRKGARDGETSHSSPHSTVATLRSYLSNTCNRVSMCFLYQSHCSHIYGGIYGVRLDLLINVTSHFVRLGMCLVRHGQANDMRSHTPRSGNLERHVRKQTTCGVTLYMDANTQWESHFV